uniref:hypothetical protein n=1 Tax=Ornithobacterium rhinotracheale TaxID=28251 RepID=UPI0039A6DE28
MKKVLLSALLLPVAMGAQTGRVGINTSTPDATLQVSRNDDLPENRPQGVTFLISLPKSVLNFKMYPKGC